MNSDHSAISFLNFPPASLTVKMEKWKSSAFMLSGALPYLLTHLFLRAVWWETLQGFARSLEISLAEKRHEGKVPMALFFITVLRHINGTQQPGGGQQIPGERMANGLWASGAWNTSKKTSMWGSLPGAALPNRVTTNHKWHLNFNSFKLITI